MGVPPAEVPAQGATPCSAYEILRGSEWDEFGHQSHGLRALGCCCCWFVCFFGCFLNVGK